MAGGIANREQNGAVFALGEAESLVAPGVPVDGVSRVLEKVGALLPRESVSARIHQRRILDGAPRT
jgi:hypothetical protein